MAAASASSLAGARLRSVVVAWKVAALGGLVAFAAYALFGSGYDQFFNRYWYNALILLAAGAAVVRAVTTRSERTASIAFAAGIASWAVGEILFDFAYAGDPPYPSVADVFYLLFYPACYIGMAVLVRHRLSEFTPMVWFDGVMAAIAAAALGSAVLFEAVLGHTDGSTSVIVTNLAYPLGDVLLLSGVAGVFALTGWRPDRTWGLIGAALLAASVADGIFLYQTAVGTYAEGTILDALWPAAMLLLAAAVWQPPRHVDVPLAGRPLLATSLVCGAIGLTILVVDHFYRLNLLAVGLAAVTLTAVAIRLIFTFHENRRIMRLLRKRAVTDALTGLANRRQLVDDLRRALAAGDQSEDRLVVIYDLDGFKLYNDSFGHPAGDALLTRLAGALAKVVEPHGACYRLGGDEFCVIADVAAEQEGAFLEATAAALSESGVGFEVSSSFGAVRLPREASTLTEALRVADQRLYAQKRERSGRREPHEMLLQALFERSPGLRDHVGEVVHAAAAIGEAFRLSPEELEELRLAARLHDVGKLAVPDDVLQKPGPLHPEEWAFIREHTVIGERILAAAPGWLGVSEIVRATHERWDGRGYPDGLAGDAIPLAARIIAVCDAFSAMTSPRPYRLPTMRTQALEELQVHAGTQFDPDVVSAFCAIIERSDKAQRRGAA
jgi:two-component system, cell cycle response regulator